MIFLNAKKDYESRDLTQKWAKEEVWIVIITISFYQYLHFCWFKAVQWITPIGKRLFQWGE